MKDQIKSNNRKKIIKFNIIKILLMNNKKKLINNLKKFKNY